MKRKKIFSVCLSIVILLGMLSFHVSAASTYIWPTSTHTLSRSFASHNKKAIDIAAPNGSTVSASRGGTVYAVYTGCGNYGGASKTGTACSQRGCTPNLGFSTTALTHDFCNYGYGNGVIIRHDDGTFASYAHMSSVSVKKNSVVSQGDTLGKSGASGYCTGPCLHVEIREGNPWKGTVLNPEALFGSSTPPKTTVTVTTTTVDSITETSAVVRGAAAASGTTISEVGMHMGTASNALTYLGHDPVSTRGTTMFYSTVKYQRPLQPGTTYYYRAYAKAGGTTYYGQIKSFTTAGVSGSLTLNKSSMTITDGMCMTLQASVKPSGRSVSWSSSNPSVATVDQSGMVTGLKAGSAKITASMTYNGATYYAYCTVTVTATGTVPLTAPTLTLSSRTITQGSGVTASWTSAGADASYYISYSGSCTDGSYAFGTTGNTSALSRSIGSDWTAGSYTLKVVAMRDGESISSSSITLTIKAPTPVVSANTRTGTVTGTDGKYLAINDAPASSSAGLSTQLGRIPPGGTVTVYPDKTSGNWYWVEYNGVSGYAYSGYITLS